jgi:hypothetical protein
MKTGVVCSPTLASSGMKKSVMGMSQRGASMAAYFMRDRIYKDKILAVIREYICNAYDEHVKWDIKEPIQVCIDKVGNEYTWKVRDYALGLNDHDIRNVFGMYFESTKDDDNDSIGGFGVGSKAGHSYTDTFTVVSHHNGTRTVYMCVLGGGEKGVPQGEIYEVESGPTTEQGIEVSLDVTKDYYTFEQKTYQFVESFLPSANIVYTNYNGFEYAPLQPIREVFENEITIRQYAITHDVFKSYGERTIVIRMGGVVYDYRRYLPNICTRTHPIVVDVPIGTFTLAVSREHIEDTENNRKAFEKIDAEITALHRKDSETLSINKPKFSDTLKESRLYRNDEQNGEWFKHSFQSLYPNYRGLYSQIVSYNSTSRESVAVSNDKLQPVYVFPNIKSVLGWHKRLESALRAINPIYNGYLAIYKRDLDRITNAGILDDIDMTGVVFMDVKKLNLPKLPAIPRDKTMFLVYTGKRSCNNKSFNVETLEAAANNKWPIDWDNLDDPWYEAEDLTMWQLHERTIGTTDAYGTAHSFPTANSPVFVQQMYDIGWLNPKSIEYADTYKRIKAKEEARKQLEKAREAVGNNQLAKVLNKKQFDYLVKNPTKVKRLDDMWKKLIKEQSLRGKMLTFMEHTYRYSRPEMTREEMKKVLALK